MLLNEIYLEARMAPRFQVWESINNYIFLTTWVAFSVTYSWKFPTAESFLTDLPSVMIALWSKPRSKLFSNTGWKLGGKKMEEARNLNSSSSGSEQQLPSWAQFGAHQAF